MSQGIPWDSRITLDRQSRVRGDDGHSAWAGPSGTKNADVGYPHLPKSPPPAAGWGKVRESGKGTGREAFQTAGASACLWAVQAFIHSTKIG